MHTHSSTQHAPSPLPAQAFAAAKHAQKGWARTPLWQRAAALHKVAALLREHAQPVADCLVKEIAKPAKDSLSEVVRRA
jgi:glyceraldehyde-3-phosphate dehydrogenase (NADP+)